MIKKQMSNGDLVQIIICVLLQILLCLIYVGIIPFILLLGGFLLSKREGNEKSFNISIRLSTYYVYILTVISCILIIMNLSTKEVYEATYSTAYDTYLGYILWEGVCMSVFTVIFSALYLVSLNYFYTELILKNTLFNSTQQNAMKIDDLKNYSAVDEILKWKELQDKGIITEQEFKEMKRKIFDKQ